MRHACQPYSQRTTYPVIVHWNAPDCKQDRNMTSENRETSYTNILKSNQQEVSLWNTRKGIRRLAIAPLLGIALTLVVMRSPELATGIVAAATALAGKGGRGDFAQDYLGARALLTGGTVSAAWPCVCFYRN